MIKDKEKIIQRKTCIISFKIIIINNKFILFILLILLYFNNNLFGNKILYKLF